MPVAGSSLLGPSTSSASATVCDLVSLVSGPVLVLSLVLSCSRHQPQPSTLTKGRGQGGGGTHVGREGDTRERRKVWGKGGEGWGQGGTGRGGDKGGLERWKGRLLGREGRREQALRGKGEREMGESERALREHEILVTCTFCSRLTSILIFFSDYHITCLKGQFTSVVPSNIKKINDSN